VEVVPLTTYVTSYSTVYAVVSRFWSRLPGGARILVRELTVYVSPEELARVREEEELWARGRARAPRAEEVAAGVGVAQ